MSILKYIELGTNAKEYFNYDGNPLPIRPLSTHEIDDIFLTVLKEGITQSNYEVLMEIKQNLKDKDKVVDFSDKNKYAEFIRYYNEVDYWIVYHAMKDYQEEEFSMPDFKGEYKKDKNWHERYPRGYYLVKQMKYIHDIAKDVIYMSNRPLPQLVEILRSNSGRLLATRIFVLNTPLTNEAWKMTPLQEKFLYYSRPGAPILFESEEDLPGIKGGTMKEVMEQLKKLGFK